MRVRSSSLPTHLETLPLKLLNYFFSLRLLLSLEKLKVLSDFADLSEFVGLLDPGSFCFDGEKISGALMADGTYCRDPLET